MARGFWRGAMVALLVLSMLSTAMVQGVAARQAAETQPVGMVSGPWRMMAWQFAFATAFPAQGLEARDGANWGVLVADITNTGVGAAFVPSQVELADTGIVGDNVRSATVSSGLGLTGVAADGTVQIAENGIARVAIVLDIPEGVGEPVITIGEESVRVESVMTDAVDLGTLPPATTAMQLESGGVTTVTSSTSYTVQLDSGVAREITLAGLDSASSCHAQPANASLSTQALYVWIEAVPGVDAPTVWLNDADTASFRLLDRDLVEDGLAGVGARTDAGVYVSWLTGIEAEAEVTGVGMHGACPTPAPEPTPSPEQIREGYTFVATQDLLSRPFLFEGEKIAVAGEVFNLEVDQDGTYMQIWVEAPTGLEAVVVIVPGNQTPGLYEGMYVTVYGTGGGTFEGTNSFGGTIVQPIIIAALVDY